MVETLIRAATSKDVDAILSLHRDFHAMHLTMDATRWSTQRAPAEAYPEWIESLTGDAGVVLVATSDGEVVGYLIAEVEAESTRHWSPASVYFHDLFIAPHARRAGLARRLVEALFAWQARHHRTLPIRLTTAAGNDAAHRFFSSLGFRSAAVEMLRATPERTDSP